MTTDVSVAQLAVGVIAVYPRRFYLYADEPGPAFDRLVNILETCKLAERHMAATDQIIGARTGCEDIRVQFGDLHGPQLAEKLADVFRDLAVRDGIGVRVYLRKRQHETQEDGVVLGLPGADLEADHAALCSLLNQAAAAAGLMPRAGD
ncbi:hypothetical protein [Mangrovihabitans endophyticus]|uniref:Uncharacterized protein n=1 Tax=Mangrovihabitans endophyticus TaxID=1751298 RepID=A0A8J3C774_9ACTN|nr:hypothetical protein [Mangrovihabitans endophyticus]GGL16248.1 hypothetical protein GCM10012284_58570 [Mangrovihabitans endophyticus]